jgi:hypothetical protein
MLQPDPAQAMRLAEIITNLHERVREATDRGWLGDVEGLQVSLAGACQKLGYMRKAPAGHDHARPDPPHLGRFTTKVLSSQQAWFFVGYGAVDVDARRLAYYRCSWSVQDLAAFAARVRNQSLPTPDREEAFRFLAATLSPTGIVAAALASLESQPRTADIPSVTKARGPPRRRSRPMGSGRRDDRLPDFPHTRGTPLR